ncbi:hypothetical protein EIP86_009937 [Pleurotus ostreatoroseus]|nr:hypothetical protein EIP86_009937 [Pleurotus ostreatoroseus]
MAIANVKGTPIGYTAIMLAVLASMGGFIFGYDTGQISDVTLMDDYMLRFSSCTDRTDINTCHWPIGRKGLIVGIFSIGTMVGSLAGSWAVDAMGRRLAMSASSAVFIVGLIIQITSVHAWQQYVIGRLVGGWGVGALSVAVPMFQAETAPPAIRGTITAMYQLFITLGILVAYCICIGTRYISEAGSWRTVVGIAFIWPTILGFGILTMPESPRWLVAKGRLDDARRSLARSRGISKEESLTNKQINIEVEEMRSAYEYEQQVKSNFWSIFELKDKTFYRTALMATIQMFQQLTGANYFFYYGSTIFKSVGISDSFITQIILGAVNFGCTFLGMYFFEKFGRRWPLIIGGLWQSAWLFVFAAAGTAKDPSTSEGIGKLMIVSACLFILGFASTWAPGAWILTGESFPTRTRSSQAAVATMSNWLWNFLLAFFTPFITQAIQFRYGFVFAACNLAGAVIVYFFAYESSGLSLEMVDMMYCDPDCKPWNSANWAPEGFASRADIANQGERERAKSPAGIEEGRMEKIDEAH